MFLECLTYSTTILLGDAVFSILQSLFAFYPCKKKKKCCTLIVFVNMTNDHYHVNCIPCIVDDMEINLLECNSFSGLINLLKNKPSEKLAAGITSCNLLHVMHPPPLLMLYQFFNCCLIQNKHLYNAREEVLSTEQIRVYFLKSGRIYMNIYSYIESLIIRGFETVQLFPTQVNITRPNPDPIVVTVEGVSGTSITGDIAIDDTSISDGNCNQGLCCLII